MKRLCISILLAVTFSHQQLAVAADHFVRQEATGRNDGSDWSNAFSTVPTQLVRGDTYYLADGSYGSYTFDDAVSGTIQIVIKKATGVAHGTGAGWLDTYGDGQAIFETLSITTSYWLIDGGGRSSIGSGHGIKVAPKTSGGKCIRLSNVLQSITLRYVEVQYMGATGTRDDGVYATNVSNSMIQYCYFHDIASNMLLMYGLNNVVEHNYFARSFSIPTVHSQAIQLFSSAVSNMTIRYNIFEDISGTASIAIAWGTNGISIHGNVFRQSIGYSGEGPGTGQVVEISSAGETGLSNARIYHNTFVNIKKGLNSGIRIYVSASPSNYVYNNIWYNCVKASLEGITEHDFNSFYSTPIAYGSVLSANERELAVNPFIDDQKGDYRLVTATDSGKVLGPEYATDFDGETRGVDGVWDRGAFEKGGALAAPKMLHIP